MSELTKEIADEIGVFALVTKGKPTYHEREAVSTMFLLHEFDTVLSVLDMNDETEREQFFSMRIHFAGRSRTLGMVLHENLMMRERIDIEAREYKSLLEERDRLDTEVKMLKNLMEKIDEHESLRDVKRKRKD